MPAFARCIGIDYSGAETPHSSLKGLRVYQADRASSPEEVAPPPSPRRYWTRRGIAEWLVARLAEDVPTLVAKSTHAGIPWLLYLRRQLGERVHFWPFDGWQVPAGRSAVVEVYPALWKHACAANGRTADQHDAYSVTAWLRQADMDGQLTRFLNPELTRSQRTVAGIEGWILGVG